MFPVKGGAFNSVNKKIRKHEVIPSISIERICIKSCGDGQYHQNIPQMWPNIENFADSLYDPITTQEPPGLGYNIEVKIVELGENFHAPKPGTIEFEDLSNTINNNFKPVFNRIPGYKSMHVEDIKE